MVCSVYGSQIRTLEDFDNHGTFCSLIHWYKPLAKVAKVAKVTQKHNYFFCTKKPESTGTRQIQNETVIVKEGLNGLFELIGKDEIPKNVKKEPSATIDLEVSSPGQFKSESNVILGI